MFTSHYNKSACVIVELLKSVYMRRENMLGVYVRTIDYAKENRLECVFTLQVMKCWGVKHWV